ncbi:MAG: hypothetical protein P1U32_05365 [Legionellaceae bacterium]|nr:hypothetical protein [Legionellaceae bacterium]
MSHVFGFLHRVDADVEQLAKFMQERPGAELPLENRIKWEKAQKEMLSRMVTQKAQQKGVHQVTLDKLQALSDSADEHLRALLVQQDEERKRKEREALGITPEMLVAQTERLAVKTPAALLHEEVATLLERVNKEDSPHYTEDYTRADYIDDRMDVVLAHKGNLLALYTNHLNLLTEEDKKALEHAYHVVEHELESLKLDLFHEEMLVFAQGVQAGPADELSADEKVVWIRKLLNIAEDTLSTYAVAKEEQAALLRGEEREGRLINSLVYRTEDIVLLQDIQKTLQEGLIAAKKAVFLSEVTQFEKDCKGELSHDVSVRMQQIKDLYFRGNELLRHPLLEDTEEMRLLLLASEVTKRFDVDRQAFEAHFEEEASHFCSVIEAGLPQDLDIDAQIEWVKYQNFMADILLSKSVVRQSDDIRKIQTAQVTLSAMLKPLMQAKYGKIELIVPHEIDDLFERLDAIPSDPLNLTERLAFIKLGVDKINALLDESALEAADKERLEEKKAALLAEGEALLPKVERKADRVSPNTVMDSSLHAAEEDAHTALQAAQQAKPKTAVRPTSSATQKKVPSNMVQNEETYNLHVLVNLFKEVLRMPQRDIPASPNDSKRTMFDSIKEAGGGAINEAGIEVVRSELLAGVKDELARLTSPFKPELRKEKAADVDVLSTLEKDLDQIKFKLEIPGMIQLLQAPPSTNIPSP